MAGFCESASSLRAPKLAAVGAKSPIVSGRNLKYSRFRETGALDGLTPTSEINTRFLSKRSGAGREYQQESGNDHAHEHTNVKRITELTPIDAVAVDSSKECSMANNKNPSEKQPGEKAAGKYHYNPGNMSGKTVKTGKEEEQKNDVDKLQSRDEVADKRS